VTARTVRVRIAVAVDAGGNWGGAGHCEAEQNETAEHVAKSVRPHLGYALHWAEAELPIPEALTVKGVVTQ
jgi:hypothetical protein